MPPQIVLTLKREISKLEKKLAQVNEANDKLLKKVNNLTKVLTKQNELIKADKLCLVPVVHLFSLEPVSPIVQDLSYEATSIRNSSKAARSSAHDRVIRKKKVQPCSYYEILDEDSREPGIKLEEADDEIFDNDEDYILEPDYYHSNSSNPPSPQSLEDVNRSDHLEEDDDDTDMQISRTSKRKRSNLVARRIKRHYNDKRKSKLKSRKSSNWQCRSINRPLTEIEKLIVTSIDKISQSSSRKPRATKLTTVPLITPNSELESFSLSFHNRISNFADEIFKEYKEFSRERQERMKRVVPVFSKKVESIPTSGNSGIVADVETTVETIVETTKLQNSSDSKTKKSKPEFECLVCEKILWSARNLKNHMLDHEGKKPFSCSVCGKCFALQITLRRHEFIHGERKEKCTQCEKCFTRHEDLQKHIRFVHEKKYKYKCSMCPKQFVDSSGFRKHERRHLGIKPHLCSFCGRSFPELQNLRSHINSLHSGKEDKRRVKIIFSENLTDM